MGNTLHPWIVPLVNSPAPGAGAECFKQDLVALDGGLSRLIIDMKFGGAGASVNLIARDKGGTKAIGTIQSIAGAVLLDGVDTFTIDDGLGSVVVFTFRNVAPALNDVLFAGGDTAAQVAAQIALVINRQTYLSISAVVDPVDATIVNLTHTKGTATGNVAVVEAVANAGFLVTGMAGGVGTEVAITLTQGAVGNNEVDRRDVLVSDDKLWNIEMSAAVTVELLALGLSRSF